MIVNFNTVKFIKLEVISKMMLDYNYDVHRTHGYLRAFINARTKMAAPLVFRSNSAGKQNVII